MTASLLATSSPVASSAETKKQQQARKEQEVRQAEISKELRTLREEVSEASEQEAALLEQLDTVQDRRRSLDGRVAALDKQVAAAEGEATKAEVALEQVQAEFVRAQMQLAHENAALAREHDRLRARAVAAYISNPSSSAAELLLKARTMRDIAATTGYLETVVEVQRNAVRRYTEARDATERLRAEVEVQKDAAMQQRNVVVNRLSDLEGLRAEQEAVRSQVVADEAEHARLLQEVRQRKTEFETQINALRAESSVVSALLQGLALVPGVGATVPGALASPVPGTILTSPFGQRLHPIFGTVRMHDGVDFGAPQGMFIRAAAAGIVVSAGVRGGYGNATILDHGGGLATLYAHQSEMFVIQGQAVKAGQVIGAVGSTGFSTGPHLHFEVRLRGVPVDPLVYLR
ncbi:MAG: peptidoglycan DD-metalloendopeptidase family protein [Acidimicrobiales bacterium]